MNLKNKKQLFIILLIIIVIVILAAIYHILTRPSNEFNGEYINCQPPLSQHEKERCDRAEKTNYPYIAY